MPAEPESTMARDARRSAAGTTHTTRPRGPRCPTCGAPVSWNDNPQRPFCSLGCRLIDLGVWLDEGYVVRGDTPDDVR